MKEKESIDALIDAFNKDFGLEDKANENLYLRDNEYLTKEYLTPNRQFSNDWLNRIQEPPQFNEIEYLPKLAVLPESQKTSGIRLRRQGLNGQIVGCEQFAICSVRSSSNAKNSLSLSREVASKSEFTRGKAGFMPFAPGGADLVDGFTIGNLHRDKDGLYDIPPTFTRGLDSSTFVSQEESDAIKEKDEDDVGELIGDDIEVIDEDTVEVVDFGQLSGKKFNDIDNLLPKELSFGRSVSTNFSVTQPTKEWAHIVDVNKEINNFAELVPNPAKVFPFELDTFQKEAVYHLEQGDSVFVAAHTSAGKTVVAEYAISLSIRNMTKTIYTSPIKALSNQKYRDFRDTYEDVGILTGDVQINSEATCLIMTTEILRSMLYRGADLLRDVEFVVFDEVHYVNDQDRGVVWEEVIIMLPDHIKMILLSATVPNTYDFASWVGRTKHKDIYVISTPKRPIPLEHYLWAKGNMHKVVDADKKFLEDGWKAVSKLFTSDNSPQSGGGAARGGRGDSRGGRGGRGDSRGGSRGGHGGGARTQGLTAKTNKLTKVGGPSAPRGGNQPGKQVFLNLCQTLNRKKLLPAVIFVFSKKKCEDYALMLTGIDYCNAKEKSEIHMFIDKAVSRLKPEDRELPQILRVRELLSRGIGVHHGGLLPIVKEFIEILFARTLVKVLFATETFAMGLNLPTRTVIFSSTRKHDGHSFRNLLPGEYTQMAGRAGRRGLDDTGTVLIMANGPEAPPIPELKTMTLGTPTKLHSQFRLTYNMILNLLRIEALKVEEMIKRSFSEHASQVLLPEHEKTVRLNEDSLRKLKRDSCPKCDPDIDTTYELIGKLVELQKSIVERLLKSTGRPGRLIVFRLAGKDVRHVFALGYIVSLDFSHKIANVVVCGRTKPTTVPYLFMIPTFTKQVPPFTVSKRLVNAKIPMDTIEMITHITLDVSREAKYAQMVDKVLAEITGHLATQHSWKEAESRWVRTVRSDVSARTKLVDELKLSKSIRCSNFPKLYGRLDEQRRLREEIENTKKMLSDQNLELLPDYEQRIQVLKDLNYIDDNLNVLLKGRVACEISSGYELIITELVLDNFLGGYEPEEIVALLSAFVFEGRTDVEPESVTPRLDRGKARILEIFKNTSQVFETHQVQMTQEEEEFAESKRFGLMEVVYEWARGMNFNAIIGLTDVAEGTIVRVITRLDEVCREVMASAKLIGDTELYDKMEISQEKIKRDIVFCASLYV